MMDLQELKRRIVDPVARLQQLPPRNSAVARAMGSDLLTIRADLD